MNIKIIGEGEPLLLIHGWGMSGKIWEVIETDLSKYYKLYIVDLPGMGKSEEIQDYSITNIVNQLYNIYGDALVSTRYQKRIVQAVVMT